MNKKYSIKDNVLTVAKKNLLLTEKDITELPNIELYVKNNFYKA